MVATAPSMLAGPPAQGRSASRIASNRQGATEISPENAAFEQLAHRPNRAVAASCLGRTRPHRPDAHRGRRRFSGPTRNGRYSWARYYHPGLQRFISEDPIGFGGGDSNLYAYVFNSPTELRDPSGLAVDPVSLTALAIFCAGGAGVNVTTKYALSGRKPTLSDAAIGCGVGVLTLTAGIAAAGAAVVVTAGDLATLSTTAHGATRIAGPLATRGGVLSADQIAAVQASGRVMTQTDGAIVRILQNANGRFNVVIEGERGLITSFENLSQKSLDKLAKNYGWQ
jgi:RHS repeat-associated protein